TATWLMDSAELRPGERVLVEAAAGGVGSLLVQLATAARARVIAAAGGTRKVELARELGSEVAVDYAEPDWAARVRTYGGGVDVVFDGVGGELGQTAFGLLERGGRMLSYGLASGAWTDISAQLAAARGVRHIRPAMDPERVREYTLSALDKAAQGR